MFLFIRSITAIVSTLGNLLDEFRPILRATKYETEYQAAMKAFRVFRTCLFELVDKLKDEGFDGGI